MRLGDLTSILLEEEKKKNVPTITLSAADFYDILGQPYPLVENPKTRQKVVPSSFFEKRSFPVGSKDGMVPPQFADAYHGWVAGGKIPGFIYDQSSGKLKSYNENPWIVDAGWNALSGGPEFVANITRAGTAAIDGLMIASGLSKTYGVTRSASEFTNFLDTSADALKKKTDLDFRDKETRMAYAISTPSDIADIVVGDTLNDISFTGMMGMMATELPSLVATTAPLILTGGAGAAVRGGAAIGVAALEGMEATGAVMKQIIDSSKYMYNTGEIQSTSQWAIATRIAKEELDPNGVLASTPEFKGKVDKLALEIIQDNTFNAELLKVAPSSAILGLITDKMIVGKASPQTMKKVVGDLLLRTSTATGTNAVDEAWQQLAINHGLITEAGAPSETWKKDLLSSAWQGAVVGGTAAGIAGTVGGVADVTTDMSRRAAQASLRQFFFGTDANNAETILQIAAIAPEQLASRVTDPKTGKLDLFKLVNTDLPTSDSLTRGQKMQLARTGATTINGQRYTRADIKTNEKNIKLFELMGQNTYDPAENKWIISFKDTDQMREAASLLGMKGVDTASDTEIIQAFEGRHKNIDYQVVGSDSLEAPTWSELTPMQHYTVMADGKVDIVGDPSRGNQTWSRDEVLYNSRKKEDTSVPSYAYDTPMPVEPRPSADADGKDLYSIESLTRLSQEGRGSIKDMARMELKRAKEKLAADQQTWDISHALSHNPDGTPILSPKFVHDWSQRQDIQDKISEVTDPLTNVVRATIIYNAKVRMANGDLTPETAAITMNKLEQNYPGISNEIFGEGGVNAFIQNPESFQRDAQAKFAENPQDPPTPDNVENPYDQPPLDVNAIKPLRGSEISIDGEKYRYFGNVWGKIDEQGGIITSPIQYQSELTSAWQNTTFEEAAKQGRTPEEVATFISKFKSMPPSLSQKLLIKVNQMTLGGEQIRPITGKGTDLFTAKRMIDLANSPSSKFSHETVNPRDLIAVQPSVNQNQVEDVIQRIQDDPNYLYSTSTADPVRVIRDKDGKLYVGDGHHRVSAANAMGADNIPVVIYDVGSNQQKKKAKAEREGASPKPETGKDTEEQPTRDPTIQVQDPNKVARDQQKPTNKPRSDAPLPKTLQRIAPRKPTQQSATSTGSRPSTQTQQPQPTQTQQTGTPLYSRDPDTGEYTLYIGGKERVVDPEALAQQKYAKPTSPVPDAKDVVDAPQTPDQTQDTPKQTDAKKPKTDINKDDSNKPSTVGKVARATGALAGGLAAGAVGGALGALGAAVSNETGKTPIALADPLDLNRSSSFGK